MVAAWRAGGTYDASRGSVRTWILSMVRNRAIDVIRARLLDLISGFLVHVPAETLNDRTELLANIFGIAGFALSFSIVIGCIVCTTTSNRCSASS